MEVLKKDFTASLPSIREAILDADFISIDAEFTGKETSFMSSPLVLTLPSPSNTCIGLNTPDVRFNNSDDIQQRYHKVHQHVQAFTVVQYGVCAFKKTSSGYVAKPYNFYVFGGDNNNIQSYRNFLSSASSLSFLRSNHFDFNKLIDEGIPFYNYSEERNSYTANGGWDVISRQQESDGKYTSPTDDRSSSHTALSYCRFHPGQACTKLLGALPTDSGKLASTRCQGASQCGDWKCNA